MWAVVVTRSRAVRSHCVAVEECRVITYNKLVRVIELWNLDCEALNVHFHSFRIVNRDAGETLSAIDMRLLVR